MGAALDAFIEYKPTADSPWQLYDGGLDAEGYPKFDPFILRGGLLYRMLGWIRDGHGTRFPRKGAPRDLSAGLESFLYNWGDADAREQMSYLSYRELVDASTVWDGIVTEDGTDPANTDVTLRVHLRLARELVEDGAADVRLVYWFN